MITSLKKLKIITVNAILARNYYNENMKNT